MLRPEEIPLTVGSFEIFNNFQKPNCSIYQMIILVCTLEISLGLLRSIFEYNVVTSEDMWSCVKHRQLLISGVSFYV